MDRSPAPTPPPPARPPSLVDGQWSSPVPLPLHLVADVANWLDSCEQKLIHPGDIAERLRRNGWPPAPAATVVHQYRRRFNEHPLGYSALLITTGLSALAAGTAGHLLTAGFDRPVNRDALGGWLALLVCALPFAAWARVWAHRADRDDPVAAWSRPRQCLATVLLWTCGVVGIGRLVIYAGQLVGALVGAGWAANSSRAAGGVNVAITVSIALPLGLWAYAFLHRFDHEDPTRPSPRRRRP